MITESYAYTLSSEMSTLKRSVMRELLKLTTVPGIISLAGGLPANNLLPTEAYRRALNAVLNDQGGSALQYRPQFAPLKQAVMALMAQRGVTCTEDQVFITNGNQQGLTILSRLFLERGAGAVIEDFTFTGIQQVTAGRGAEVYTVPTDLKTGVDVEALEAVLRSHRPRMAILIPGSHNPLGVTISDDKRRRIAELADAYETVIVEDAPYDFLNFSGDAPPAIRAYNARFVFYLGSFSKILAPAARWRT